MHDMHQVALAIVGLQVVVDDSVAMRLIPEETQGTHSRATGLAHGESSITA